MAPREREGKTEHSPLVHMYQAYDLPVTRTERLETNRIDSVQLALSRYKNGWNAIGAIVFIALIGSYFIHHSNQDNESLAVPTNVIDAINNHEVDYKESLQRRNGTYKLQELHEGESFFEYYDFFDGPDSNGSAGYINYVGIERAKQLGIFNVTTEDVVDVYKEENDDDNGHGENVSSRESFVYMGSSPTKDGPRDSIRLEGKRLFNDGLFIIDLRHMPAGCGTWPAFWLTNEQDWPDNGEIDIVEGVNYLSVAKTALHTNKMCSMYGHVPEWYKTGAWDLAQGIPDKFTNIPDNATSKPADDCWNNAPHQWGNQGCVALSPTEGTLGVPFNENGGGVFALEWDPNHARIRTWVFSPHTEVPRNLQLALQTAHLDSNHIVVPDTEQWPLPYGYFAIGDDTGCTADHFTNMHLVVNLAFCGSVAGNRYFKDCPKESNQYFTADNDPVLSCNKYIAANPDALDDAYWKIRGVYVYQRASI